jgi:hypothetical protein
MRRNMVLLLGAVLAALAIGVGATYALFSASIGPQEATFTAGTVRLDGYRAGDIVDGPMFYITAEEGANEAGVPGALPTGFWAPGDTVVRGLQVQNTGSLDAKLMTISAVITGDQALAEVLQVRICDVADCSQSVFYEGTLAALAPPQAPHPFQPPVVLAAGAWPWEGDRSLVLGNRTFTPGNRIHTPLVQLAEVPCGRGRRAHPPAVRCRRCSHHAGPGLRARCRAGV